MRLTSSPATFIVLWACLLCQSAFGQIPNSSFAPAEQIVVLQNGEILTGQISQSTTNTIVETKQGSRLVLNNARVNFICDTIHDAYWGKCARTKANDVAGQKSLFYWCLKHGLHDQAQNQILLLTESKTVKASDLEFLDRQLNVAIAQLQKRNQRNAKQQLAKTPAAIDSSTATNAPVPQPTIDNSVGSPELQSKLQPKFDSQRSNQIVIDSSLGAGNLVDYDVDVDTFRPLPAFDSMSTKIVASGQAGGEGFAKSALAAPSPTAPTPQPNTSQPVIQQVGFDEEVEPEFKTISLDHKISNPAEPETASEQSEIPTVAQLDQMTRSMPDGTIRPYRSKLERVLINGCSAAKCHNSISQIMPLMDLGKSKPITRRMSQRNLHQTLKYVDKANPFNSRLLAAASHAHGGNEEAVLPVGSKHFEQLKLWVIMLSDNPEENYQAYLNPELQNKLPTEPINQIAPSHGIIPVEPERIGLQPLPPAIEHSQTIGEIPVLDNQADSYKPIDPFDPEVFNRQFGDQ